MYNPEDARRLFREFEAFVAEEHSTDELLENPHFRNFLDFLVERPCLYHVNGRPVQKPIRKTLAKRVAQLQRYLRETNNSFQITAPTRSYVSKLQARYVGTTSGAPSVPGEDVERVVRYLDTGRPRHLRLRAITLLVRHAWARPSEIIYRHSPDDINADHFDGVVITVARSKTNNGSRPEYFKIRHGENPRLCAVCALREWVQWLGPDYRGPLFPALTSDNTIEPRSYSVDQFSLALKRAFTSIGLGDRHYSAYSLRKGGATEASAQGMPLKEVQNKLRHSSVSETLTYIDRDVLFTLMRNTLE